MLKKLFLVLSVAGLLGACATAFDECHDSMPNESVHTRNFLCAFVSMQ